MPGAASKPGWPRTCRRCSTRSGRRPRRRRSRTPSRAIGMKFPPELRESLAVHAGQRQSDAAFGQWELFDLERVTSRWDSLAERVASGQFPDHDEPHIQIRGPVRPRWWDRAWIPVAADGTGDLLAVDLNPPA